MGASTGLGRALGRELAARGYELVLVSRDHRDLDAEAAHLRLTHGIRVKPVACDVGHPAALLDALQEAFAGDGDGDGDLDAVLCPIGAADADDDGNLPLAAAETLMATNFLAIVGLMAWLLPILSRKADSCVVGFSSIAAARGRGKNVIYAAAKRALESYFESLRHMLADRSVQVQLYRLGYLDTQQSFGKKLLFPKADPARLARRIASHLNRDVGRVTLPRYWRLVVFVVSWLPWWAYRRLRF